MTDELIKWIDKNIRELVEVNPATNPAVVFMIGAKARDDFLMPLLEEALKTLEFYGDERTDPQTAAYPLCHEEVYASDMAQDLGIKAEETLTSVRNKLEKLGGD